MKTQWKLLIVAVILAALSVGTIGGCSSSENDPSPAQKAAKTEIENHANDRVPYTPKHDVEFNNYNRAQELYDSPSTIIWCSVMPQSSTAPIITVPIAGKLTSSSTTFFRPEEFIDRGEYTWQIAQARSVDGMYHPNPPQYRYGFTPGGQYVDFFQLPTFCTTSPLSIQKDSVAVSVDSGLNTATKKAEALLKEGKNSEAQKALSAAAE